MEPPSSGSVAVVLEESCRGGFCQLADDEDAGSGPAVEAAAAAAADGDAAGELVSPPHPPPCISCN